MAKKQQNNNILGKVAAGAAIVGAGALAAKVLSDEDNRKKIGSALNDAKEKGQEIVENVKDRFTESIETLRAEYDDLVEKIESKVEDAKNSKHYKDLQANAKKLGKNFDDFKDGAEDKGKEAFEELKTKILELRESLEAA